MANYAFTTGKELQTVDDGHEFIEYNFAQEDPHTAIFSGITGLTFTRCNLMNCDVPGDAVLNSCLNIQKSLCTNLHPNWGISPVCDENCSHVVDTDEVWIDGVLVDIIYHYEDTTV